MQGGKAMRGAVFHYDEDHDFGYINGEDGMRYIFAREDLGHGVALVKGTPVEFQPDDRTAHAIIPARAQTPGASGPAPLTTGPVRPKGLWNYFWRALRENHVNFAGRASRQEFWGFHLFWLIVLVVTFGFAFFANVAVRNFSESETAALAFGLPLIFVLVTILPWLALIVRRLHDIGQTGWLALLCYVPGIGALAIVVFGLVPSQKSENQWGAVPTGVRV
jgi:uncharacterized membrane protein YhaH (DUF805 family)